MTDQLPPLDPAVDPLRAENTEAYKRWVAENGEPKDYTDWEEVTDGSSYEIRRNIDDLVGRLIKRAEIRRSIPTRKSVQEGERDRIADLLDEAALYLRALRGKTLGVL